MNTESAVYQAMRRKLPQVAWQRVENWAGAGVPDVNGAFLWPSNGREIGIEIWCELKVCKLKSFKTEGLWRPAQIAYQTKRSCISDGVWNLVSHPRAELLYIYSGDKTSGLSIDSTGSTVPDLVLGFKDPWSTFLDLAARRILDGRPIDPTGSTDPPAAMDSIDPLGR